MRTRDWPPYFELDMFSYSFEPASFLVDNEIREERLIPKIYEMKIRKKDIISECSIDSIKSYSDRHIAIINPFDDSRINHSSIDEGKINKFLYYNLDSFKVIVARKLKIAHKEDRKDDNSI